MSTDTQNPTGSADASAEEHQAAGGIDMQKPDPEEFHEVVLKVGPGGARRQRFFGRLVGESRQITKIRIETIRVYVSRKGKYVLQEQQSNWADLSETASWLKDWKNWRGALGAEDIGWGDYTVEVLDSVEELRDRVPERIYHGLADTAQHPYTDDLDI